jgi:hypothetical protein
MKTDKHQLEYSIHSAKVTWCPICCRHFYNEVNLEHDVPKFEKEQKNSNSDSVTGLSEPERDMEMIFCAALLRSLSIGDDKLIKIMNEYRGLMNRKEEVLKELKGT